MIKEQDIQKIQKEAKKYFLGANGCHDWTHVERVHNLAMTIGKKEKANLQILKIAAYLHDICRKEEMRNKGNFCHAEEGAKIAEKILSKYDLSSEEKKNIIHCILTHRYRNNLIPKTIEAKVLYDADKLDSIGAIGVARTFLFAGDSGSKTMYTGREEQVAKSKKNYSYTKDDSGYLEYVIKLKNIYKKIITKSGKKIAFERNKFMKNYFKRFWEEIRGEK